MTGFVSYAVFLAIFAVVSVASPVLLPPLQAQERSDALRDKIKDLQKEYENSKRELEEGKKRLKEKENEKKQVQSKLTTAEKDIAVLNNDLISIRSKERRLGSEINGYQNRLVSTERDLAGLIDDYAGSIRSMYMRRYVTPFELMFAEGSYSSVMRGMTMFASLAREDIRILEEIRQTKKSIEGTMQSLKTAREAQRSLSERKQRDQASLAKSIKDRQELLSAIRRDEELQKSIIIERQRVMEQIHAEIDKLQRLIASEVSKSGFLKDISDDVRNYNFAGKKGSLPWPAKGEVVSGFGIVTDPMTKTQTKNRGIEIEVRHRDPVYVVGSGIVVRTISLRGYGNLVWVYHMPNHYTIYGHLSDILVNEGSEVREGEIIGLAGSTGLIDDTRAMLLFEVLNGKNPEDPSTWLKPDRSRTSGR